MISNMMCLDALGARHPMNKPNSWSPQLEHEQDLSLQTTCEATLEQDVATGPESSNTTDGGAVPTSGRVQEQVQSLHKLCGDNLAQGVATDVSHYTGGL